MKKIEYVIVHCSDSPWGCARDIRQWHQEKGWKDIGYQFVVLNGRPAKDLYVPSLDGSIECGRYLDEDLYIEDREIGAHALGYNSNSIGICLIGVHDFDSQMLSLLKLCVDIAVIYKAPVDNFIGHNETDGGKAQGKTCPNFDMSAFREILRYELSKKERT